jgi:FkbM family methyltransferase
MTSIFRRIGREMRRTGRALKAFWDLPKAVARLNELAEGHRDIVRQIVAAEIDRLDSYMSYHAEMTAQHLDQSLHAALPGLLWRSDMAAHGIVDLLVRIGNFDVVVPCDEAGRPAQSRRSIDKTVASGIGSTLKAHLLPGSTAVDIGSAIGLHALEMAAAVGPTGSLTCFEPSPHLAAALARTLRLNGFEDRVRIRQVTLDDRERAADDSLSPAIGSAAPQRGDGEGATRTISSTLDDQLLPGARIDLIRFGPGIAPMTVWRGMAGILRDNPNLQLIVAWSTSQLARAGQDPVEFITAVNNDGFAAYRIVDGARLQRQSAQQWATLDSSDMLLCRQRIDTD